MMQAMLTNVFINIMLFIFVLAFILNQSLVQSVKLFTLIIVFRMSKKELMNLLCSELSGTERSS